MSHHRKNIPPHSGSFSASATTREGSFSFKGEYLFINQDSAWIQIYDWMGRRTVWIQFTKEGYLFWLQRENKIFKGSEPGLLIGDTYLPVLSGKLLYEAVTGVPYRRQELSIINDSLHVNRNENTYYHLMDNFFIREEWQEGTLAAESFRMQFLRYDLWGQNMLPAEILIKIPENGVQIALKIKKRSGDLSHFKPLKLPERLLN